MGAPIKEGMLHKRGTRMGVPAWNERWLVVTSAELSIHNNPQERAKHSIAPSSADLSLEATPKAGAIGFQVTSDSVKLELAASSWYEARAWICALKQSGVQSTKDVDLAFQLRSASQQASDILVAFRALPLVFRGGFTGRQRDIRLLGRYLDAVALSLLAANIVTLHIFSDRLLSSAALLFFAAATIEFLSSIKGSGSVSITSCGAFIGDFAACIATLIALAFLFFAHVGSTGLVLRTLLHAAALFLQLNLAVLVAIKARKFWGPQPPVPATSLL